VEFKNAEKMTDLIREKSMRMLSVMAIATAASLAVGGTISQAQQPPASYPAIKTTRGNNANAPVPGANSFTMAQAKSLLQSKGFSNISALKKGKSGIWRGTAEKVGQLMDANVDFQGNVFARPYGYVVVR